MQGKWSKEQLETLPGWEFIGPGLCDLAAGRTSIGAILVLIGAARLRRQGFEIPTLPGVKLPYEHSLYSMIEDERGAGAHSYYNSLIRRLVSFERALENSRPG